MSDLAKLSADITTMLGQYNDLSKTVADLHSKVDGLQAQVNAMPADNQDAIDALDAKVSAALNAGNSAPAVTSSDGSTTTTTGIDNEAAPGVPNVPDNATVSDGVTTKVI